MNDHIFNDKSSSNTYKVLDIIRGTTVDGPGFRTSIYLAGCSHRCPGCHNPQSWDPENGIEMTLDEIMKIVKEEEFDVTLSGGDPLYNPEGAILLAKTIKEAGFGLWLYTGYTIEEIRDSETLCAILKYVDAVVDGPFIQDLSDTDLQFRGSSNQRIIKL